MKTQALQLPGHGFRGRSFISRICWNVASPVRTLLITLSAALPAAGIAVLSVWAFSNGSQVVATAALWAGAFVFLALAVDSAGTRAFLLVASGALLMVFAGLGSAVAAEFGMLGGFTIAAWIAVTVVRGLTRDRCADRDTAGDGGQ